MRGALRRYGGGSQSCRLRATSRRSAARRLCRGSSAFCATCWSRPCWARARLPDAYLRRAGPEPFSPAAGGRRAERGLRADVAAPPGIEGGGSRARRFARMCWARSASRSPRSRAVRAVRAGAGALLAPGFQPAASRFCSPSTLCGCRSLYRDRRHRGGRRRGAQRGRPRRCGRLRLVVFNCRARGGRRRDRSRCRQSATAGAVLSAALAVGASPVAADRRRAARLPDAPRRRLALARRAPLFRAGAAGPHRGRHPAAQADRRRMVASSSPAAVSWLYYAYRLYELPLGRRFGRGRGRDDAGDRRERARRTTRLRLRRHAIARASRSRSVFALPAAIALGVAGAADRRAACSSAAPSGRATPPRSRPRSRRSARGLPGHALEKVLGAVSFAHEDTRTPMLAALAGLATARSRARCCCFPRYGHRRRGGGDRDLRLGRRDRSWARCCRAALARRRQRPSPPAAAHRAGDRADGRCAHRRAGAGSPCRRRRVTLRCASPR